MQKHDELKKCFSLYAANCEAALRITLARLHNLDSSLRHSENGSSPFSRIESRLKTFDSTLDKLGRRRKRPTPENIYQTHDIAGIRIITVFRDEIFKVAELIGRLPGLTIAKRKDYVTEPKENGYSSLHLIVQVEIYDPLEGSKLIPVEIQIRDKTMDLWATMEHTLSYKHPSPSPEVKELFGKAAKALQNFAETVMALRDHSDA